MIDASKIIHGVVGGGRYTVTSPIVKEDYGLLLQIEGVDLPSSYQVDFSNSEHGGTSVTMISTSNRVRIPTEFIKSGKDVFAFLYIVGSNYGRTVYKFRIPNKLRPDRTNVAPDPEEQSVIDQAISALNDAVEQTAQDVIDADASAQSASQSAESAEASAQTSRGWAESAEDYAQSAEQSELQASASAEASAQSASQSAQIKADVEDLVDDAQSYAESALIASQASVTARDTAQGHAQSASASAQSASTSASNASTSAQTASTKASEASTSAQTASQKATESAQSASQALSYKTDAESAKTASQTAQGLAESAKDTAVSAKDDAESARDDAETARDEAQSAVASISGALTEKAPVITDTASGTIASFSDGADNLPLKSLIVDINPIQDLSQGDPSPENICPISGWTEVDVEQSGVNVWDEEWELGVYGTSTGNPIASSSTIRSKSTNYISVLPKTNYYFKTAGVVAEVYQYRADKSYIGKFNVTDNVFETDSECHFVRFDLGASYGTTYNHDISINYPSTDHSYHPYAGRSITINLGQTVYGGKLDVLSGELVIDRAMVDLGTLNWDYEPNYNRHGANFNQIPNIKISGGTIVPNALCSKYKIVSSATGWANRYTVTAMAFDATYLRVYNDGTADAATYKIAMDGVQLVYELATPIEIQLSANQINSLYGVNNLWADSGDTTAEYRADTKLFIERLTAPDSADMIADANITSGKYFMVGNSLYKATANIANGSAIIVGTNCIRKSLSEALNEINA